MFNLLIINIPFIIFNSVITLWLLSETSITVFCNQSRVLTYEGLQSLVIEIDSQLAKLMETLQHKCVCQNNDGAWEAWRGWRPGWKAEWQWQELLQQHPRLQLVVWARVPSPWDLDTLGEPHCQSISSQWVSGLRPSDRIESAWAWRRHLSSSFHFIARWRNTKFIQQGYCNVAYIGLGFYFQLGIVFSHIFHTDLQALGANATTRMFQTLKYEKKLQEP